MPVRIAQWITCLTADPGVVSLIPAWSHTFMEIDHEIISTAIGRVTRLTDHPDMTIAVEEDVKHKTKPKSVQILF